MTRLYFSGRRYTLVSACDHDFLTRFKWFRDGKGYLITKSRIVPERRLHRLVAARAAMSLAQQIDHRNRNKNDNRRGNLRPASNGQNRANSKRNRNNSSGFKGVHLRTQVTRVSKRKQRSDYVGPRWSAQINVDGRKLFLGDFMTPQEAHAAYTRAAREYFREFAHP
jgi:hypothetical protein